jgi:UDP-2-acetamido-2,6-beta-L-arabino-hexul-4-ose reductase
MIDGVVVSKLHQKFDDRGWLAEILQMDGGGVQGSGQIFVSAAKPGVTKGRHYHTRKVEWFCVIHGRARLVLEELKSGRREEIEMGESSMVTVKIPPGVGHAITNVGSDLMLLMVYVNEVFDPANPDTIPWSEK